MSLLDVQPYWVEDINERTIETFPALDFAVSFARQKAKKDGGPYHVYYTHPRTWAKTLCSTYRGGTT